MFIIHKVVEDGIADAPMFEYFYGPYESYEDALVDSQKLLLQYEKSYECITDGDTFGVIGVEGYGAGCYVWYSIKELSRKVL